MASKLSCAAVPSLRQGLSAGAIAPLILLCTQCLIPIASLLFRNCYADLNLLKHDKPLAATGAAAAAAHLKHIPAYLRDPTLQGRSFVGNAGALLLLLQGCCSLKMLLKTLLLLPPPPPLLLLLHRHSPAPSACIAACTHTCCPTLPNRPRRAAGPQAAEDRGAGPSEGLCACAAQGR